MLSLEIQAALTEMGQVDVLIEMMAHHLTKVPTNERNAKWYELLESALYLLETTYKAKKAALILALEGGAADE
jgi:hypothetical protein